MSIIIGLTGRAGCGKDTAAEHLQREYGFHPMAFAGPLKKTAATLFNLPETYFHDRELKEKPLEDWDGLSPRHILQLLGTEAVRCTFGENFWIKRWINEYGSLVLGTSVVVTDVRFNNEAQAIRDLGGVIVHIARTRAPTCLDAPASGHASEGGVLFYPTKDIIIRNDGTIVDLWAQVDDMFTEGACK